MTPSFTTLVTSEKGIRKLEAWIEGFSKALSKWRVHKKDHDTTKEYNPSSAWRDFIFAVAMYFHVVDLFTGFDVIDFDSTQDASQEEIQKLQQYLGESNDQTKLPLLIKAAKKFHAMAFREKHPFLRQYHEMLLRVYITLEALYGATVALLDLLCITDKISLAGSQDTATFSRWHEEHTHFELCDWPEVRRKAEDYLTRHWYNGITVEKYVFPQDTISEWSCRFLRDLRGIKDAPSWWACLFDPLHRVAGSRVVMNEDADMERLRSPKTMIDWKRDLYVYTGRKSTMKRAEDIFRESLKEHRITDESLEGMWEEIRNNEDKPVVEMAGFPWVYSHDLGWFRNMHDVPPYPLVATRCLMPQDLDLSIHSHFLRSGRVQKFFESVEGVLLKRLRAQWEQEVAHLETQVADLDKQVAQMDFQLAHLESQVALQKNKPFWKRGVFSS